MDKNKLALAGMTIATLMSTGAFAANQVLHVGAAKLIKDSTVMSSPAEEEPAKPEDETDKKEGSCSEGSCGEGSCGEKKE